MPTAVGRAGTAAGTYCAASLSLRTPPLPPSSAALVSLPGIPAWCSAAVPAASAPGDCVAILQQCEWTSKRLAYVSSSRRCLKTDWYKCMAPTGPTSRRRRRRRCVRKTAKPTAPASDPSMSQRRSCCSCFSAWLKPPDGAMSSGCNSTISGPVATFHHPVSIQGPY